MFYNMLYLTNNKGVLKLPGGETLSSVLAYGALLVALFIIAFLFYTNSFLMKRRKKELGLYHILGMERKHLYQVVYQETLRLFLISLVLGMVCGILLSGFLYALLLRVIGVPIALEFSISGWGIFLTLFLFFISFWMILLYNFSQIRKVTPRELMQQADMGEREPRTKKGLVVLGVINLLAGYGIALTVDNIFAAIPQFFLAAVFVVVGTFALFTAGSIWLLKRIRNDRERYYTPRFFIAVSGLLYRMKQNAAGLASICVLSTMILVTMTVTLSVVLGEQQAMNTIFPTDIVVTVYGSTDLQQDMDYIKGQAKEAAQGTNAQVTEVISLADDDYYMEDSSKRIGIMLEGTDEEKNAVNKEMELNVDGEGHTYSMSHWICRQSPTEGEVTYRAMHGGFFFLGLFLGILFLIATTLIMYYKQISEGYDDQKRYIIMKQVGMSDEEIKNSINQQVRLVFFLPLGMSVLHTMVAFKCMAKIGNIFSIGALQVLLCTVITIAVFAAVYLGIYRSTAGNYYRIMNQTTGGK
ncbi:MAG: ABC transporter permease [Lachnospiraceae bacterium]|nr:ABC transporter permease [Lachnospiraceae bacterium]